MPKIPIAVQMYTVRDAAAKDFIGTLKKVAKIGYAGVELAGTPIPVAEIKKVCDDLGLAIPSIHIGYNELVGKTDDCIRKGQQLGVKYLTCSGVFGKLSESAAGWSEAAQQLSVAGEHAAAHGMDVCYHNHNHEFKKFGVKQGYAILFGESDHRFLKAEIDTYWVEYAHEDPAAYIKRKTGRCPLVHMKDMAKDKARSFAEIGTGIMDFPAIIRACKAARVEWYIVEQDDCKRDPFESIKISLENLKKMTA